MSAGLNNVGQSTIFKPTHTKTCKKCGETKHISNFHKDKHSKDGHHPRCITCAREKHREWCKNNNEKVRLSRRNRRMKVRYGIDNEDYTRMEKEQNGVCSICGQEAKWQYGLCIDHCHKTNTVRGLLCNSCNSGLGCFYDNAEWLQNAIKYIARTKPDEPPQKR